jgi:hypothetical protein
MGVLPNTSIHLKISIFVKKKIMKDYGMPFKNAAIDRLGNKFGDPDKPKVEGPINLMGVQNALNKGVAVVKKAGQAIANTKINNPVRVTKSSNILYDELGGPIGRENITKRKGLIGDRNITRKEATDNYEGTKTYSRSVTNPKGGKMIETTKTVSLTGDMTKGKTRYDKRGDVMTSRSRSKQGKFFK